MVKFRLGQSNELVTWGFDRVPGSNDWNALSLLSPNEEESDNALGNTTTANKKQRSSRRGILSAEFYASTEHLLSRVTRSRTDRTLRSTLPLHWIVKTNGKKKRNYIFIGTKINENEYKMRTIDNGVVIFNYNIAKSSSLR